MRDLLPADVRKREYVIGVIKQVYESYGFEPLETPAVENLETLTGKYGDEGNQLIFKILKRGEKLDEVTKLQSYEDDDDTLKLRNLETSQLSDLALRYDLTVPLARVVANNKNDLPKFFKRYQIQPVWRADRPARGRFREFYQCDVDAIGSESMVVEVELINAVSEILTELGFEDFVIRLNHRQVLAGMLESAGIEKDRHLEALTTIDKLDKIGIAAVTAELHSKNFGNERMPLLLDFLSSSYSQGGASLHDIANFLNAGGGERAKGHYDLAAIDHLLRSNRPINVKFDPSLARGLSYYTGTIMEVNVDGIGSLGGGGRYDGLIGMFGKEQIPACGFSLGLERILVVMEERGMFDKPIAEGKLRLDSADVMVTIWSEETTADSLKLAGDLRAKGLRVTLYPEADKLGKQLKYADTIKVPYVCVLGESEIADGTVTLKNMKTGEQETIGFKEIATKIKQSA